MAMTKRPTKRNATRALRYSHKYWDMRDDIQNAHLALHRACYSLHFTDSCAIDEQELCPHTMVDDKGYFSISNFIEEWEKDGKSIIEGYDGFRVIGSGSYRTGVLAPDGYVYKIGASLHNRAEHEAYNALSKRIAGEAFKIAECVLFELEHDVIAAMPLVETIAHDLPYEWHNNPINHRVIQKMDMYISDIHNGNWGVDADGWVVCFDYGFADPNGGRGNDW